VTGNEEYLLDNQQVEAGQRFDALSELFNPSTFRHAQAVGLEAGWRVWEVGAGSPSVPAWFAEPGSTDEVFGAVRRFCSGLGCRGVRKPPVCPVLPLAP